MLKTKATKYFTFMEAMILGFSCSPTPKPNVDALKMVLREGSHSTRVKNFPENDQKLIMDTLKKWLN